MQLSKVLLVIGATSVCLTPLPGHTADKTSVAPLVAPPPASPDAVEKARAAMRQKMDEVQAGAPAPAAQAPVKIIPPAAEAPTPAPATATEPAAPSRTVIPVADPAALEKARTAMRQKMDEIPTTAPAAKAPAYAAEPAAPSRSVIPEADPAALEKARTAMHQKMDEIPTTAPAAKAPAYAAEPAAPSHSVIPEADPAALQKARTAMHQKMTELPSQPTPATTPTAKPTVTPVSAGTALGFEPLPAPPSPLSASQQQRLADLLVKYKADQITPEQYHAERAKILTAP